MARRRRDSRVYNAGVIPIRDVLPSRTTPYCTIGLIVVNLAAFLATPAGRSVEAWLFLRTWGLIPSDPSASTLLTSLFIHAGLLHLCSNLLFLWIFGDNVEDRLGHVRFLAFYLACGLAAAGAQVVSDPSSSVPMVGASGAVAGVLGAYLFLFPGSRVLVLVPITVVEVRAVVLLGAWFALQVLGGLGALAAVRPADLGAVAFWAHVGGFLTGALLARVLRRPERMDVDWWDLISGSPTAPS